MRIDTTRVQSELAISDSNLEVPMKTLTIRNVSPDLADALEQEKRRRGVSLNRTVIELLSQGLGVGVTRSNGLAALAGTWSGDEFERFERAVAPFGEVDPELWR
jgi:hypothetical protein